MDPPSEHAILALFGDVRLDDTDAAEGFSEAAGNLRGDLAALAKERPKAPERHDHPRREDRKHDDTDDGELPVQIEQHAERDDGRHEAARQLNDTDPDEIADAIGVVHDAGDQHAGLRRIEVTDGKARDVPLHALAHVRDGALRRHAEHLRQAKMTSRVDQRGGGGGQRQRNQQVCPSLADDVVDEKFGRGGKDEAGKPVDEHQREAERQPATMGPDQLPGLGPGVGDVVFRFVDSGTRVATLDGLESGFSGFWDSPRQLPILDPMRLVGGGAEASVAVGLVILVIPLEPHDLALAFERQHMGGDAVEEPAVVADDDDTTRKLQQRLFQGSKRVDVEVVGRLVEQQHVAAVRRSFAR